MAQPRQPGGTTTSPGPAGLRPVPAPAEREGRVADLLLLQRPVDHRRSGQSAWVSYWRGDDGTLWAAPQASAGAEGHR